MQFIKNQLKNILATAAFVLTVSAINISATTFTVTNTNDSGAGSLRQAILNANAAAGADTIVFDSSFNTARTITLAGTALTISNDATNALTINGPGANLLTVNGNNASRVFTINIDSVISISGMTITQGNDINTSDNYGGGIRIYNSIVNLTNVVVTGNTTSGSGGGVFNSGSGTGNTQVSRLNITNCTISNNVSNGDGGGGFYTTGYVSSTISNSTISNNRAASTFGRGGGVYQNAGQMTISNSVINGNSANYDGGGVVTRGGLTDAFFSLRNSTVSNNTANADGDNDSGNGGGLNLELTNSTVSVPEALIINSTISGNRALGVSLISSAGGYGGGIQDSSRLDLINSTVSGNSAGQDCGGLRRTTPPTDAANIINSTIVNNSAQRGGGICSDNPINGSSELNLRPRNSIIANNTASVSAPDVWGIVNSGGYNLIRNTSGASIVGTTTGNLTGVDPLLGALSNNGGATLTHALQSGSPAINTGSNVLATDSNGNLNPFDQRGACFERFVGGRVDIGAFEFGANADCNPSRFDFDGDGRDDVSVFRPPLGAWYLQQSTAGFTGVSFGQNGDTIAPADYDGDGRTDIAVFRAGTWYLLRSSLGFTGVSFGQTGDIPQPGDYDGDGKADLAVFRPANGAWYLQRSSLGFTGISFGQTGDKPVAADYDGDGKTDIAVNRAGVWYIQRSQLGFTGITFGDGNDKPVPADYDADGRADVAVFRPSNGAWYLQQSTAGFTGITFGISTDLPVPADYDGDGRADVAVFRSGTWYIQRSTQGFTGVSFGATTDKPVPNAFVP